MFAARSRRGVRQQVEPLQRSRETASLQGIFRNGARGTRTPDLLGAIQALSQLSYSPACPPRLVKCASDNLEKCSDLGR
jgi:hypothetical protein